MPISFGLGYQDLPNLQERIKTMHRVLHGQARHLAELAKEGSFSDGKLILWAHAEETIRQVHRELALQSLHSEKSTHSAVEVFEMLKTWQYLQTEHINRSISINTVVNDLEVILALLEQRPTAVVGTAGSLEKTTDTLTIPETGPKDRGARNERRRVEPAPVSRDRRLRAFAAAHAGVTFADIRHSASVHKPEFRSWRRGKLPEASVMSQRIEAVLSGRLPLGKNPRKQVKD
jgi:hypothetical protein